MKSILLTSTALVAFAGAVAAEGTSVTNAFEATLGYNTEIDGIGEDGFYWEGNLKTTATATLDNGLTAGAYFEVTVAEEDGTASNDGGIDFTGSDFVISLEAETAGLFFGDTGTAADRHWTAAGNMEQDGFTPDGDGDTAVLRGDVTFGGVEASVSYLIDDSTQEVEQLSFGAAATFGAISLAAGYQEEITSGFVAAGDDFDENEIFGVAAAGTFAGATITVAYAERALAAGSESSTGVKIAYPFGPVTLNASYVDESNGDANWELGATYADGPISVTAEYEENGDEAGDTDDWTIEGTYDVGNGITVLAGVLNENEGDDVDYYAGATYDLGGGAEALFVFAEDADGDQGDEIGADEYDPGVTIQVSFNF